MKNWSFHLLGWPNIAGSALALLGLGTHLFLELTSANGGLPFWYALIPALYLFGYLLGYLLQDNEAELKFYYEQQNVEEIKSALNNLVKKTRRRLPKPLFSKVQHICQRIESVLPSLVNATATNEDLFTVKQTVFDYLPSTIESYLKLPTPYARMHKLYDGKTAQQLLTEQITVIDDSINEIVANVYANDVEALRTNTRFLRERLGSYQKNSLTLPK